jgi:hypothetical protein
MVFSKIVLYGEGEHDNQNLQGLSIEKEQDDIETLVVTIDHYRQKG